MENASPKQGIQELRGLYPGRPRSLGCIVEAREAYRGFIEEMRMSDNGYRFTARAEATPFSLCFAVFGLHLLGDCETLQRNACVWAEDLRSWVREYREQRQKITEVSVDKPFLQLLTFTLSALSILNMLKEDPLEDVVSPLVCKDVTAYLDRIGALDGVPGSGNLAMFAVVLLLHARDYFGIPTESKIEEWVQLHLKAMNHFGFWGANRSISYLQFQNGYHQYEIFGYLKVPNRMAAVAAESVAKLADSRGQFAPYPGGGACYDYDAVFLITQGGEVVVERYRALLLNTGRSILENQNPDGGFGESPYVRPRSLRGLAMSIRHIVAASDLAKLERLRRIIALQHPKHNRICTHWSTYCREWNESNLWDSWFRMLTVARIDKLLSAGRGLQWGFLTYPGIGFSGLSE